MENTWPRVQSQAEADTPMRNSVKPLGGSLSFHGSKRTVLHKRGHGSLEAEQRILSSLFPFLPAFPQPQVPQLQDKGLLHSRQLTHLISPPLLEVNKHHPKDRMHLVCDLGHHGIPIHTTPLPSESFLPQLAVLLSKTPMTPLIPFFTSIPQKGRGVPRHTHFLGAFALKRYLGDNGKQPSGEGGHTP